MVPIWNLFSVDTHCAWKLNQFSRFWRETILQKLLKITFVVEEVILIVGKTAQLNSTFMNYTLRTVIT